MAGRRQKMGKDRGGNPTKRIPDQKTTQEPIKKPDDHLKQVPPDKQTVPYRE